MKKIIVSILCFLLGAFSYAQSQIDSNGYNIFYYPNGVKSSEGMMLNGQPDGWWKSYNKQGKLVSEGNRKEAKLDSIWRFYNDNGDTTLIIHYKNGKKEGSKIKYSSDEYIVENWAADTLQSPICSFTLTGKLKCETPIENGQAHGLEKTYDSVGNIIQIAHYYHGILSKREQINRTDQFGNRQGNWKYFYNNGQLMMEGTYLNNQRHGFFKKYDENGNLLSVEKYENDLLIVDAKETKKLTQKISYHTNGQPAIIATYFREIPDGLRREFDTAGHVIRGYIFDNGILLGEGITDLNGLRQGHWKEFYKTGEVQAEGNYQDGKREGNWLFFLPNKTIEVSGSYNKKGNKIGEWKWFYPNGQLMMVAHYTKGILDGEFVEYDETGEIVSKGDYVDGAEEGHWYYRNGTAYEEGDYYDGMRTGLWKSWYDAEHIFSEIEYDQDLMNGKYTLYYDNNNIKRTGTYIQGEREGVWYDYTDNGTLSLTTLYKEGIEIRWNNYTIEY